MPRNEWPTPRRRTGLGAGGLSDPILTSTAMALLVHLQDAGCINGVDQSVTDFQNAWNSAKVGSALVLANGQPGADGLYGANTQSALQTVLNAMAAKTGAQPDTAPTGCVAAAAGSANATEGGGAAPLPATNTTTTTPAPTSNAWILWVVGAAGAGGLVAAYLASRKRKPVT
jgi:hypothetical protein